VKLGFFFASKRNEIFASISNFASEAKVRAHPNSYAAAAFPIQFAYGVNVQHRRNRFFLYIAILLAPDSCQLTHPQCHLPYLTSTFLSLCCSYCIMLFYLAEGSEVRGANIRRKSQAREYWISYSGSGILAVVWFGSSPNPHPPPISSQ
jgi:hypothetical protein